MIIHNPILTGSFTVNGTDVSSITSSAASITAINSYTASQNILNGTYATTGSNTFKNPQTINSNLTVTGSVGIGITNPLSLLHLQKGSGNGAEVYTSYSTASVYSEFVHNINGGALNLKNENGGSNILLRSYGNSYIAAQTGSVGIGTTTPARKLVVQDLSSDPFISILGVYPNQGGILFGDTTYTDASCAIRIDRTNNALWFSTAGISSEKMRITSAGYVGIGITSPATALDVSGSLTTRTPASTGAWYLKDTSGSNKYEIGWEATSNALYFYSYLASATVLRISGSNVGIGTTSPTGLLDVASRGITKGSMPAGTVLQVVQTFKSDFFSIASGTPTDITGFSATITPTSSTSKILVFTTIHSASDSYPYPKLTLYRGSTAICLGTAGTNTTKVSIGAAQYSAGATPALYTSAQTFLDSPATTSAVTYKWQVYTFDAPNRTWYMNRTSGDTDGNNHSAPSTITLMEIAQ